jgi:tetratricopeptide (TPR) repeat protein
VAVSYPEISLGPLSRFLGILSSACRNFDDAADHFEHALATSQTIGARPWLAHTQDDYAHTLLQRDAPGDSEKARSLLDSARATYGELGMRAYASPASAVPTSSGLPG